MKIPEDIRLLLIVVATIGAVTGVAVLAVLFAPAVSANPDLSIRIILALLLAFVTVKFFLYILEAAIVVIGTDRGDRWGKGKSILKSAHPAIRIFVVIVILAATFAGWYFLIYHFGRFFLPGF